MLHAYLKPSTHKCMPLPLFRSCSISHSLFLGACACDLVLDFGSKVYALALHYTIVDPAFYMLPAFIIVIIAIVVAAAASACYYSSTDTSIACARAFRATGLYFMIVHSFLPLMLLLLWWSFSLSLSLFLSTVAHTHSPYPIFRLTPLIVDVATLLCKHAVYLMQKQ